VSIAISSPVQCTYRTRWPATRSRIFLPDGSETFPTNHNRRTVGLHKAAVFAPHARIYVGTNAL
jgi:hypothetical protein